VPQISLLRSGILLVKANRVPLKDQEIRSGVPLPPQGHLGTSMRHPPAAENLEPSHWRPLLCCARFSLLFASTPVAELPSQGLFCRRTRAVRIFSRILLNCILNDHDVHRAKVSHCILPTTLSRASSRCHRSQWPGSLRANNHFFSGDSSTPILFAPAFRPHTRAVFRNASPRRTATNSPAPGSTSGCGSPALLRPPRALKRVHRIAACPGACP
jgi:hypothetical protein